MTEATTYATMTVPALTALAKERNIDIKGMKKADIVAAFEDADRKATDGYTSADVAEMLEMSAKDLRVYLRAMGRGVSRGNRYSLTSDDVAAIQAFIEAETVRQAAVDEAEAAPADAE